MMRLARVLSPKVPRVGDGDEPQRSQVGASTGSRRTITGPLASCVAEAVEAGVAAAHRSDALHSHLEDDQPALGEIPPGFEGGGLHH
jgi:hypothetical protein